MKKWIISAVLIMAIAATAEAQQTTATDSSSLRLSSGELFQGMSKAIPTGRVILPYGLEVTFEKTTHLIFPAAVRYVDLGSDNLVAGKAQDAENVLRIKAAVKGFQTETNLSVICDDGSFYAFNVRYAEEPEKLSIEMQDFLHGDRGRLPSNRADIYFKELANESPALVKLIMKTIRQNNKRQIKHIGCKQFGLRFLLRGLYAHNGLFYFHIKIENETNIPYPVDFISFKVVDKKGAKRTAIQERLLQPLRAYHPAMYVKGRHAEYSVFALEQFALSQDKQLEVTLYEQNAGRSLTFYVQNSDLLRARQIDNLKLKW